MTVTLKNNPYNIRHIEESIITLDKLNQSKALETGNVSSDKDVYADVLKYAHSTFDKSKFEIVGSPVITDDGIASGLAVSGVKIGANLFGIPILPQNSVEVWGKVTYKMQKTRQNL